MVRYSKASLALPPSSPSKPAASILYVILNNNTDAPSNNNDPWHNISHQALLGIEHQLKEVKISGLSTLTLSSF